MKGVIDTADKAAGAMRTPIVFAGRPDMHSRILAQYLSSALYANCHFDHERSDSEKLARDALVLIDCKHHDHEAIVGRLDSIHAAQSGGSAVLLNANPSACFDALIQWPSLRGIFYEDCSHELLLKGMQSVLRGEIWLPRSLLEASFDRQRKTAPPSRQTSSIKLSRRERDILQCIARADSNADIAAKLHISEHTVKSHVYNIFRKIEVRNRTEASHWAMQHLTGGKY